MSVDLDGRGSTGAERVHPPYQLLGLRKLESERPPKSGGKPETTVPGRTSYNRSCDRSLHLKQAAEGGPGEPLHRRYHAAANGHRPGYDPGTLWLLPGPSSKPTDTRVRPLRPEWALLGSRRGYRSLGVTLPGRGPGPASSGAPYRHGSLVYPGATLGASFPLPPPVSAGGPTVSCSEALLRHPAGMTAKVPRH